MKIPFVKAQGAGNDFLLTWEKEAPVDNRSALARAICDRHTGAGADGWYLVQPSEPAEEYDAEIHLYNSDGSRAELSGNGTRCVAALLVETGLAGGTVRILTGAGLRTLRLLERRGLRFSFEMEMGSPRIPEDELRWNLPLERGPVEVTTLNVGNPQCVVFVEDFPEDWRRIGAEIERHPHFPERTNVSFVRVADRHTIEARFYERGAGETLSSGTGSMGAAVAAIARGLAESPVRILTPAGPLELRWEKATPHELMSPPPNDENARVMAVSPVPGGYFQGTVFLRGPAVIVARGEYYC